jgi:hypothetical protein
VQAAARHTSRPADRRNGLGYGQAGWVVARYYDLSHPAASGVGIVTGILLSGLVYQFARVLPPSRRRVNSQIGPPPARR